jgi:EAL domain-containing protein (putative c-di-GMP-specific phosphodiesterase class I)/GGDEF domain-containing protein
MPTASLPPLWVERIQRFDHAFQPIVNVHTGLCYGYEALLRGVEEAGFDSIQAVFDTAFDDGVLPDVETSLWARAIEKFARVRHYQSVKLFCNADGRGVLAQSEHCASTIQALADVGLPPTSLCLEISERHHLTTQTSASGNSHDVGRLGFRLAVDDFGRGFSGLELLYNCPSDFVKIDRFFIARIERDHQKRVLAETMAKLAHLLGRFVVAEGVETDAEFAVCRELGCDLVQGYLVQRPTVHVNELAERYDIIANIVERERRRREAAPDEIAGQLDKAPTLPSDASLSEALQAFGRMRTRTFLVVVDPDQRPLGLVREQDLKDYLYNPYGRDLLSNAAFRKPVLTILGRCPVVDIYAPIERFIDAYVQDQGNEGVIVLRDMKYAGFLDSRTLLNVVSERNLAAARDQNPLTRLPGNRRIYEFVSRALGEVDLPYTLVYFDFDHFKPFNDKFGFRQGDRALILFSEMLSKALIGDQHFVGHIGGDDFFCGARDMAFDQLRDRVGLILDKFRHDIESFYDADSRTNGGIVATDRDGVARHFPLMRVSAVAVDLRPGRSPASLEQISGLIAAGKRIAKKASGGLHIVTLSGAAPNDSAEPAASPQLVSASD